MLSKKLGPLQRTITISITFLICYFLILSAAMPVRYDFKEGDICTADIFATRDIEDTYTTQRQKEAAAEQVKPRYKIDTDVNKRVESGLSEFMTLVWNTAQIEDATTEMKVSIIKSDGKVNISDDIIQALISMPQSDFESVQKIMTTMLRKIMDEGVRNVSVSVNNIKNALLSNGASESQADLASEILAQFIAVNQVYDQEATENEKQRARDLVEPTVYKQNQIIIRRGEQIKDEQIAMLSSMGLLKDSLGISYTYAAGIGLMLLTAFGMVGVFLRNNYKEALFDRSKFLFLCLVPTLTLAMFYFFARLGGAVSVYYIPVLVCVILLSIFIDRQLSILVHLILCVCLAIMMKGDILYCASFLFSGFFAAYVFKRSSSFGSFAVASVALCGIQAAVFAIMGLVSGAEVRQLIPAVFRGVINGILTSVIAVGIIPFFEFFFNITTPLKLSELSNPDRKLLKRMLFEAPGTYHHSLMVGNLAEAACYSIGADALLARVGAYYHDIGKLKKPAYFKENQLAENPHDSLPYDESAKILTNHVKDGDELAKQYHLPKSVRDIITQHHGTTIAGMFYQHAVNEQGAENVDKADFMYPGPKPQTKEAAIVMLADSCEAAVRSLDNKSEKNVEQMVNKIIDSRLLDGQLNESNLTFRDLGSVKNAFIAMFEGYFHKRIKYTELVEEQKHD